MEQSIFGVAIEGTLGVIFTLFVGGVILSILNTDKDKKWQK